MKRRLLASAPTLELILDAIQEFYCGERKALSASSKRNEWHVTHANGEAMKNTAYVVKKRNRYRFEGIF